ncbi:MAG TPA: hypothetical protein VF815_21810 [Myxococcaceae bacterium]
MNAILSRANIFILLLVFLIGCAGNRQHSPGENADQNTRIDNLRKAVQLPWKDDGSCVVREAPNEWPVVVERCFHALDLQNIRFETSAGKCAVDSADTTAPGKCLLAAVPVVETSLAIRRFAGPQLAAFPLAAAPLVLTPAAPVLVAAGVIVVGGIAAVLIVEAIADYVENTSARRAEPEETKPRTIVDASPTPKLKPKPHPSPRGRLGPDLFPSPPEWKPDTDRNKEKPGRIYVTYTKRNHKTNRYYSGRTSMLIDLSKPHYPQAVDAIRKRDKNHHIEDENPEPKDPAFDGAEIDKFDVGTAVNYGDRYQDLAYWRIRGREQQLIDRFGGAWSDTGGSYKTENNIRAVAKDHKLGWEFHKAAADKWGELNEYTGD